MESSVNMLQNAFSAYSAGKHGEALEYHRMHYITK